MGLSEKVMNRRYQISKKLRLVCEHNKLTAELSRLWGLLGKAEDNLCEMMDLFDELIDNQNLQKGVPPPASLNIQQQSKAEDILTSIVSCDGNNSGDTIIRGRPLEKTRSGPPGVYYRREISRSPSTAKLNIIRTRSRSQSGREFIEITTSDNVIINALPDSGAALTVLPKGLFPNGTVLEPSHTILSAANGTPVRNIGKVVFIGNAKGGPPTKISAIISPDIVDPLIGKKDLMALGILPPNFPAVHHCQAMISVVHADKMGEMKEDAMHPSPLHDKDVTITPLTPDQVKDIENAISRITQNVKNVADVMRIRQFLVDSSDVMVSSLDEAAGSMKGFGPMKIELDHRKGIIPYHVTTARSIPVHYEEPSTALCRELIRAKMMVRCPEITEWCAPAHFVPKGGGNVRMVVDYRKLNKATRRPVHPFSSVPDLMHQILPESRWFAKLDAVHGYFQIPLDEASSYLCAFLLPDGKYRPLVAPMGWKGSGDVFSLRTDMALEEFRHKKWIAKIIDDICVQAVTLPELMDRLASVIAKCREHGIKLSIKKFEIGQSVKFAGFIVSSTGMKPDPSKLCALQDFPTPKSLTDLRSFLGLANQLGAFIPDLQHSTVKMRELLKKNSAWLWLPDHESEFRKAKELLTSPSVVQPFDPKLHTQLLTDASRLHGLGFALIQRERAVDGQGKIRLIQCGSCSLSLLKGNARI